ncbi:MAG: type I polyketide synthase, partial [Pseudonocardia sp.]|nr:type I polyketide synthase [Pseudonocardia sp.]
MSGVRNVNGNRDSGGDGVAVVGIACRLPSASSPTALWELLRQGVSAVGEVPAGRWPDADPVTRAAHPELRWGGFLDEIAEFDADFFAISPREATAMDPQQRLALELCWEALEDAGLTPDDPARRAASVFLGAMSREYAELVRATGDPSLRRYILTGNHQGSVANRVSYCLGLTGTSLTVDCGQSSSLVSVQLACENLATTGAGLALAGGVDLNVLQAGSLDVLAFGALSAQGRCATMDASADGYVRGEGGAVVVLKPLADALRDGDRVYCVIRGGAVNNDGGGVTYTTPDDAAQEALLRAAYRAARVDPADVAFVELHGTGTRVGDPVEARALGAVLGRAPGRRSPLLVGSVKTNIGHLEAAAGVTGLVKAVLALWHGELPASLHFETPNPVIDFDLLNIKVARTRAPLPDADLVRFAGVSAFGMGGTNCHLVLAGAPARAMPERHHRPTSSATVPVVLSARDPGALRGQAAALAAHLDGVADPASREAVAASLVTTRALFDHRAVIIASEQRWPEALAALAQGHSHPNLVTGSVAPGINTDEHRGQLAFMFPRYTVALTDMGVGSASLSREIPEFAEALDEVLTELDHHLDRPLRHLLAEPTGSLAAPPLEHASWTRPALFAIEVALARTLEHHGVRPDVLIGVGDSVGEIAAACHAGVLSLPDACRLVAVQGDEAARNREAVADSLTYHQPRIPVISDRFADFRDFRDGMRSLVAQGVTRFVEVGPGTTLTSQMDASILSHDGALVSALSEPAEGSRSYLDALARLHVTGVKVAWRTILGTSRAPLPTYAFQRERYWVGDLSSTSPVIPAAACSAEPAAAEVLDLVREHLALLLGYTDPAEVDVSVPFQALGMDSMAGAELSNELALETGLDLPVTLIFDYPTPLDVARHLTDLRNGVVPQAKQIDLADSTGLEHPGEPIAIIGMACRLPGGVTSPDELWELVRDGRDVLGPFPSDRGWDPELTGIGGFVDAAGFDAGFFSISPREALAMNPQQRLVLESAWEALERAGLDPTALRGSDTGVYLGVSHEDYGPRLDVPTEGTEGHLYAGSRASVVSGRVSYVLGLEGPALSVDTACSSSLVALHSAIRGLRGGECSLALAGGVTVMALPGAFHEFIQQGAMAADGRCKAFADAADGTSWGEGVGLLVLERLSDAERLGHEVLAVVRGSAVNSDGASNGLTAPNGLAQRRVIQRALRDARLSASEVDVVEAHGTGTKLGDPIEARALFSTYGGDRHHPLLLGSIKSNIGHTQAAAGVAGVIKMVEALRHAEVPKTLHVDAPSSQVDWTAGGVELVLEHRSWPAVDRPRRAAVSSFGISGTNAHVILEQAPEVDAEPDTDFDTELDTVPWMVSAADEPALRARAGQFAVAVEHTSTDPIDVARSLARSRAGLPCRAVVTGRDRTELISGLRALAEGAKPAFLADSGASAVVFSGQGAQRPGMGRELYARFPTFAKTLDEVCAHFQLDCSLRDVLFGDNQPLDETAYTQAALFAYEVALFRLVEEWGLEPRYLMGHSLGELVAAYVAGVWSLEDACRLVAARGRLMGAQPAGGAMVSVQAAEDEVVPLLRPGVEIAAVNAPKVVVVSGDDAAVARVVEIFQGLGRKCTRLRVSHAFHSPHMDGMLAEFAREAAEVEYHPPRLAVVSNLTGQLAGSGELTDPGYWVRHVREAVRFADGVAELARRGVTRFIEIGPDAALTPAVHAVVGDGHLITPLQRRNRAQVAGLVEQVGQLYAHGVAVCWDALLAALRPGHRPRQVSLPTYPFQRTRFWLTPDSARGGDVSAAGLVGADHPLLGAVVGLADGDWVLSGRLALRVQPWLADHVVLGSVLFPGTGFLELALRAGELIGCDGVSELTLAAPLV